MKATLLIHAAATLFMVGAIWLIQVVHYALFNKVGAAAFPEYEYAHTALITPLVGIPMLIEAMTGFLLLLERPATSSPLLPALGIVLIGVVWLSTMFIQVPLHNTLAQGFNEVAYAALVSSNWIRTLAWTARGGLVLWMLSDALG